MAEIKRADDYINDALNWHGIVLNCNYEFKFIPVDYDYKKEIKEVMKGFKLKNLKEMES